MSVLMPIITLAIIVCSITLIECKRNKLTSYDSPDYEWWGPDDLYEINDTSVRPFTVVFEDEMILDLRHRLLNYRPSRPTFHDVGFTYGFNTREMPEWIDYWANRYPFKQREDFLNQFPQFETNIQGLSIHFIWVSPKVPRGVEVVPLLLLHGWPGSVREFYETIPLLTTVTEDRDFAIEVIAPSLPGFGFSDGAARPGFSARAIGVVLRNLMHRLGYMKFYIQGGDWGALICANIATLYPDEVLGYHTNFGLVWTNRAFLLQGLGDLFPPLVVSPELADRMYPLIDKALRLLRQTGYLHIQATTPDTVGICLSDSPAALLAYTFTMFPSATRGDFYSSREDGGLWHYPKETLIDNLMLYWTSNSITTSLRIYAETLNKQFSTEIVSTPTKVPTWVIQAKFEAVYHPPIVLKTKYPNLLHTTVLEDGGHFLAMEMPKIFADDVLNAVENFRIWHQNISLKV